MEPPFNPSPSTHPRPVPGLQASYQGGCHANTQQAPTNLLRLRADFAGVEGSDVSESPMKRLVCAYPVMSLVLGYLSASDAASLLYALGVIPDDWMKKRYLNPVRDLGGLSRWLTGKMMDNSTVMLIGMDVERWIARIRRPWDASWKREYPIMVWVAVVPLRDVMKESKEIRLYKSILASPDEPSPHGHLQMLRMHTHGWMNEFMDPGIVKQDRFSEGNMWVRGPMIDGDNIMPMFLNYQWSYRPGTTVDIHRGGDTETERRGESLFMVRELPMPTGLCDKVYETIWYDVASESTGRATTSTTPYLSDIEDDGEGPSAITVLVCMQPGFKQTLRIPLSSE